MAKKRVSIDIVIRTMVNASGLKDVNSEIKNISKSMNKNTFQKTNDSLMKAKKYARAYKKVMESPEAQKAMQKLIQKTKILNDMMQRADTGDEGAAKILPAIGGQVKKASGDVKGYADQVVKAGENTDKFVEILGMVGLEAGGAAEGIATAAAGSTALTGALIPVAVAIAAVVIAVKVVSTVFKKWAKQLKGVGKSLKDIWGGLKNSIGAFRLMAQGVLTVARSMTFFVSAPITIFLKKGTEAALAMEDALIRVAKVTDNLFDDPADLTAFGAELAKVASVSVSSAEEMAKFAEQLGQMGVSDKEALNELVAIMDVVASATNMTADTIATDLGAISNAFGHSMASSGKMLEDAIKFVDRTAEVINALENEAGTTGAEIVNMLKDVGATFAGLTSHVGEFGKTINMNIGQVAGWVTIAKELGMTAEEVGTAMRRMPSFIRKNADAIDEWRITTEKFSSSQEFLNGLHTEFYAIIDSLISALAEEDDAMKVVAISTDLLGQKSGRLIQNLVKAKKGVKGLSGEFVRYDDIMKEALKAWEEGGSLMAEYDRVLNSTTVKAKMLKNGFENLSITVGNDLLPVLSKLIDVASAGALAFSELYTTLSTGTKKVIGKIIALAALYGPISWFLSQTVFGLTMVLNGLMRIGAFIGPFLGFMAKLVGGILTLNPALIALGAILFGVFNNFTGGMTMVSDAFDRFFTGIIDDTASWTEVLMNTWAGGIIEGSKAVIHAISTVAGIIASFLEAHSPPKQGPLSSIDMWGAVLMNTFLKGFAKADFGILSDVASTVEGILGSIHFTPSGDDDEQERKNVIKGLIKFREQFSKLLKDNRKGAKITEEYLDNLLQGYGDSKDEVKALVKAHLALERVQRRLAEIEQERSDISERYEDQVQTIRLSGATAEEMVESIASAGYERNQNLGALSAEEKLLEKREEMFQLQLDTQQELLSALQEQSDLWKELLALQSASSGGGDVDELIEGVGGWSAGMDDFNSKAKLAQLRFLQLRVQAEKFKFALFTLGEVVGGIWKVLQGVPIAEALDPKKIEAAVKAKMDPDMIKNIVQESLNIFGDITVDNVDEYTDLVQDKLIGNLRQIGTEAELQQAFNDALGDVFEGEVPQEVSNSINSYIEDAFSLTELPHGLLSAIAIDEEDLGIGPTTGDMIAGVVVAVTGPLTTLSGILTSDFVDNIKGFFTAIGEGYKGIPSDAGEENSTLHNIGYAIGQIAELLVDEGGPLLEAIGNFSLAMAGWMLNLFGETADTDGAISALEDILIKITDIINAVTLVIEWLTKMEGAFGIFKLNFTIMNPFKSPIKKAEALWGWIKKIADLIASIDWSKVNWGGGGYSQNQGGGWMMAGETSKINEAGGELFSAPFRGKVTSHSLTTKMMHDISGAGGTGGMSITINNPSVRNDQDIDQLVDTLMYRIAQEM